MIEREMACEAWYPSIVSRPLTHVASSPPKTLRLAAIFALLANAPFSVLIVVWVVSALRHWDHPSHWSDLLFSLTLIVGPVPVVFAVQRMTTEPTSPIGLFMAALVFSMVLNVLGLGAVALGGGGGAIWFVLALLIGISGLVFAMVGKVQHRRGR